ncbi:MAG: TatD family hydrolase [Lachnospiraceae bacterium]
MIFESHAHYDDEVFDQDREELLGSMASNGIDTIINVCANPDKFDRTIELIDKYPFVYGAVGVHPDEVGKMTEETLQQMEDLCTHPKVVAIGEIGLDYYWDTASHDVQKKWFERQMELAAMRRMPFIIHSREAAQDTVDMMKYVKAGDMSGGVVHCFSYGKEIAREYLNMGLHIGIGGVVTFKNAKKVKEVVAYTPLENLLLETDSPYLAPEPFRGKRNSSLNIPYIAKEIARIKDISYIEVVEKTAQNAKRLFLQESSLQ